MSHLSSFQALLREHRLDAAIVSDSFHQRYLSDFSFDDGLLLITQNNAYLLTDFRYLEAAKAQACKAFSILTPEEGQLPCVAALLAENHCKTVAIEEASLSYADFLRYREKLGEYSLQAGESKLFSDLRICKDENELETIKRAQKITDAAFAHILKQMTPNMTEIEVALELEFFMRRNGADDIAFPTIAVSGSNSARPHGVPRPCVLEKGFLTMDFGARVDGYCSDMTRTVVIGKADAEMKRLYQTVLEAQTAALDACVEGVPCKELDRIARDIINGAGYEGRFGHSLGHGVGMLVHENPRLSTSAAPDSVLQRGHVVTVEPGIYLEGKYGCRIEDMVAVQRDGSVYNFTQSPKDLIELF